MTNSSVQTNITGTYSSDELSEHLMEVRHLTEWLASDLSDGDATVQSMVDASPAKWHLAHTTWFFETVILAEHLENYQLFNPQFQFLFNSYYETLGDRHPRHQRGMLTRPALDEVLEYRLHVNAALLELLTTPLSDDAVDLLVLGINHEQQHQELLLTDILHLFAQNPLKPAFKPSQPVSASNSEANALNWIDYEGGQHTFGHAGNEFSFDCEGPAHDRLIEPFQLASRCVTNAEWIEFIKADSYNNALLWLSDGWARRNKEQWNTPLYWENRDGEWWSMTLRGLQPLDLAAPVTHISYFEANAFARFAGKRLPTEFEWELASRDINIEGNMLATRRLRPAPAQGNGLTQMFGDVWEWTQSPFAPYPRYKPVEGAIGEYNGKFMNAQYVLKGGSLATAPDHMRASYRNFFFPHMRWQFSGLRLADDK